MITVLFWPKTHAQASMCDLVQNPRLVFPPFCAFLTNCFAQSDNNFKAALLIDRTILWHEFMMHQYIAILEQLAKHSHLTELDDLGSSGRFHGDGYDGFNVIAIHS